jgi:hypothetical protein
VDGFDPDPDLDAVAERALADARAVGFGADGADGT